MTSRCAGGPRTPQGSRRELATDEPGYAKWIEAQAASGEPYTSKFNWEENGLDPYAKGKKSEAQIHHRRRPAARQPDGLDRRRPAAPDHRRYRHRRPDQGRWDSAQRCGPRAHPATSWRDRPCTSSTRRRRPGSRTESSISPRSIAELAKDLPIQFAPDGTRAGRQVQGRPVLLPVDARTTSSTGRAATATSTG